MTFMDCMNMVFALTGIAGWAFAIWFVLAVKDGPE